ncbi:MAG: NAD(P)H-binding protein [Acidimicrobiales bacterium]
MVGATGFVGRKLSVALVEAGYDVIALSRRAPEIAGAEGRSIDVADEMALQGALAGCETAFYLVHSLSAENFRARDHQLAMAFGRAAAVAGLRRIVYLGGLGHDPESEHLVSRQEVRQRWRPEMFLLSSSEQQSYSVPAVSLSRCCGISPSDFRLWSVHVGFAQRSNRSPWPT